MKDVELKKFLVGLSAFIYFLGIILKNEMISSIGNTLFVWFVFLTIMAHVE